MSSSTSNSSSNTSAGASSSTAIPRNLSFFSQQSFGTRTPSLLPLSTSTESLDTLMALQQQQQQQQSLYSHPAALIPSFPSTSNFLTVGSYGDLQQVTSNFVDDFLEEDKDFNPDLVVNGTNQSSSSATTNTNNSNSSNPFVSAAMSLPHNLSLEDLQQQAAMAKYIQQQQNQQYLQRIGSSPSLANLVNNSALAASLMKTSISSNSLSKLTSSGSSNSLSNLSAFPTHSTTNTSATATTSSGTNSAPNSVDMVKRVKLLMQRVSASLIPEIDEQSLPKHVFGGLSSDENQRTQISVSMIVNEMLLADLVNLLIEMAKYKVEFLNDEEFIQLCSQARIILKLDVLYQKIQQFSSNSTTTTSTTTSTSTSQNYSYNTTKWIADLKLLKKSKNQLVERAAGLKLAEDPLIQANYNNNSFYKKVIFQNFTSEETSNNRPICQLRYKVLFDDWFVHFCDGLKVFQVKCTKTETNNKKTGATTTTTATTTSNQPLSSSIISNASMTQPMSKQNTSTTATTAIKNNGQVVKKKKEEVEEEEEESVTVIVPSTTSNSASLTTASSSTLPSQVVVDPMVLEHGVRLVDPTTTTTTSSTANNRFIYLTEDIVTSIADRIQQQLYNKGLFQHGNSDFYINPQRGNIKGGDVIYIEMKQKGIFLQNIIVLIGGKNATVLSISNNSLIVKTPPHSIAGFVPIEIFMGTSMIVSDESLYFEYFSVEDGKKRRLEKSTSSNDLMNTSFPLKKRRVSTPIPQPSSNRMMSPLHYQHCWAVIIAMDSYERRDRFDPLSSEIIDSAIKLGNILRNQYQYNVIHLINKDAEMSKIIALFDSLAEKIHDNDCLLVFFAGHSAYKKYSHSHITQHYLCPYDCNPDKLAMTALNYEYFTHQLLEMMACKHYLFLFDSAYHQVASPQSKIATNAITTTSSSRMESLPLPISEEEQEQLTAAVSFTTSNLLHLQSNSSVQEQQVFFEQNYDQIKAFLQYPTVELICSHSLLLSGPRQQCYYASSPLFVNCICKAMESQSQHYLIPLLAMDLGKKCQQLVIGITEGKQVPIVEKLNDNPIGKYSFFSSKPKHQDYHPELERTLSLMKIHEEYMQQMEFGDFSDLPRMLELIKFKFNQVTRLYIEKISTLLREQRLELDSSLYTANRLNLDEIEKSCRHLYLAVFSDLPSWMMYRKEKLAEMNYNLITKYNVMVKRIFIVDPNKVYTENDSIIKMMKYHVDHKVDVRVVFKDEVDERGEIPGNFSLLDLRVAHVMSMEDSCYPKSTLAFTPNLIKRYYSFWLHVYQRSMSYEYFMNKYIKQGKEVTSNDEDMAADISTLPKVNTLFNHGQPLFENMDNSMMDTTNSNSSTPSTTCTTTTTTTSIAQHLNSMIKKYKDVLQSLRSIPAKDNSKLSPEVKELMLEKFLKLNTFYETALTRFFSEGRIVTHSNFFDLHRFSLYEIERVVQKKYIGIIPQTLIEQTPRSTDTLVMELPYFTFESAEEIAEMNLRLVELRNVKVKRIFILNKKSDNTYSEKMLQLLKYHHQRKVNVFVVILEEEKVRMKDSICILDGSIIGCTTYNYQNFKVQSMDVHEVKSCFMKNLLSTNENDVKEKIQWYKELKQYAIPYKEFVDSLVK